MTPEEHIAQLEAENASQRDQIAVLVARVQELEARLAKDSHNSGKPPSSDGLGRKTKSLRKPSGKKPGGQLGHRGETLRLVAVPDDVIEHRPSTCSACHIPLPTEPSAESWWERRQVHELPPLRLLVREHRALHVRCPACRAVTAAVFPSEAPSRAQYGPRLRALVVYLVEQQLLPYGRVRDLLADLFGAQPPSAGTLVHLVRRCAATLEPVTVDIAAALHRAPVLHNDETGVRLSGRLAWAHVASTARLTHYGIHAKRGSEATAAIGILPGYQGVSVHDGWAAYRVHTSCRHALCPRPSPARVDLPGGAVSAGVGW